MMSTCLEQAGDAAEGCVRLERALEVVRAAEAVRERGVADRRASERPPEPEPEPEPGDGAAPAYGVLADGATPSVGMRVASVGQAVDAFGEVAYLDPNDPDIKVPPPPCAPCRSCAARALGA
jgi:hypothetical protein